MNHKTISQLLPWGSILFLAAVLSVAPFLSPDHVIYGFDMEFHLGRIEGIAEGLRSGQFPVRVNPVELDGGGMPTGIFYPDIFLYIPAVLHLLGMPLLACWKALFVLVSPVTVFASWWAFGTHMRSLRMGAVASLLYLIGFWRLFLVYIGTSIPSVLAMAFFPAALAAIWQTLRRDAQEWPWAVFFSTCILQAHILTSLLLVGTAGIMMLCSFRRFWQSDVRQAAGRAVGFTFLLNLWFFAPLLYFHQHMDYLMKAAARDGVWEWTLFPLPAFDFYIGSAMLFLVAGLAGFMLFHRDDAGSKPFWIYLLMSAAFLLLMPWKELWHTVLAWLGGVLQFPMRLSVFPAIFLAMAVAVGFETAGWLRPGRSWRALVCVILVFAMNMSWFSGYHHAIPLQTRAQDSFPPPIRRTTDMEYMTSLDRGYNGTKDYMDVATNALAQRKGTQESQSGSRRIMEAERRGNDFRLHHEAGTAEWIRLPVFWYMGYAARDSAQGVCPVRKEEDGKLGVLVPATSGTVHVWYEGLPWFHVTDLISWFSLFGFLYAAYRRRC